MPPSLSQARIEQWIQLAYGTFSTHDIWADVGIELPENRDYLRVILSRLEQKGIIVRAGRDGFYRKIENECPKINWKAADPNKTLPLILPFDIHRHCRLYPKSIVIVAGEKNAGKTSFLYKSVALNMNTLPTDLYNSETGSEQMNERFEPLDIPEIPPFNTFERYDNFGDVVHPEHLSIIDYLDLNSEVYLVGAEIDAIFRKLTTGVAIIGLQKPPAAVTLVKGVKKVISRDLAYGGGFTAKRAQLYISLGNYRLKLVYVKTPAKSTVNPSNMQWSYSFDERGYFKDMKRAYGEPPELDLGD